MTRGLAMGIVAALVVLAGCADGAGSPASTSGAGSVDVATAELVRLKQQAGMADCPPSTDSRPPTDALPDVTLPCLGGGRDVRLAGLDGPLVLNVWASYCAPCREELPVLQRLHDVAGDELTVLGVDYEDTAPGSALQLAADAGVTFASVADPGAELRADLEVIALPQTVFVAADGSIVATERRQLTSYDLLADLVEQHLAIDVEHSDLGPSDPSEPDPQGTA
jgi:cytochrome c biogenesis protein CcmG, thiol:disulfide interchange protein DsbE